MELKDVILSTLAEIEELTQTAAPEEPRESAPVHRTEPECEIPKETSPQPAVREDEVRMLEGIRERLLVLFEGFQSPNNVAIESKVDLTLNFLEYLLATIDSRLDAIKD